MSDKRSMPAEPFKMENEKTDCSSRVRKTLSTLISVWDHGLFNANGIHDGCFFTLETNSPAATELLDEERAEPSKHHQHEESEDTVDDIHESVGVEDVDGLISFEARQ